jgi:DNA-binding HxlR family transcriptional regulator
MRSEGYNQFCPIAKACELIEPRWTLLLLSEMWSGSTHFNEIKRGVPGMSPTLMSRRLKQMEENGLVNRSLNRGTGEITYTTTQTADELAPIVRELGLWANRNVDSDVTLEHLDARLLMWNMRRKIDQTALPQTRRSVIEFSYPELPREERDYWLVNKPGAAVDLCLVDPGYDVDLYIEADLKAMTAAWMGMSCLKTEIARGSIALTGDRELATHIEAWMVRSSFAAS